MSKQVILNLPVKDNEKSKAFFLETGFSIDSNLSDENATCFTIINNVVVALLLEHHYKKAINGDIADASKVSEVLISIGLDSKEEVNKLVDNAVKAGGSELHEPIEADGIYGRSFSDPDHHRWNIFYMNPSKGKKG